VIRAGDKISEVYILQVGHVERSNITSLAITDVIQTPGRGSGGGYGTMHSHGNDTYEDSIHSQYYESGTQVFYRIIAKDESGNTVVTPVYTFTLTETV